MNEVSVAIVIDSVARVFERTTRELRSRARPASIMPARQAVCLLALELTGEGSPAIGRLLGARNHTTVLRAADDAKERCAADESYAVQVEMARRLAVAGGLTSVARDPDATASAQRLLGTKDPINAALRVSALEIVAMAARLAELEEAAATAFQLLLKLQALGELRPHAETEHQRWQALRAEATTREYELAGALGALGYCVDEIEETGNVEERDADAAAVAG